MAYQLFLKLIDDGAIFEITNKHDLIDFNQYHLVYNSKKTSCFYFHNKGCKNSFNCHFKHLNYK
jgi:hypothetical protein